MPYAKQNSRIGQEDGTSCLEYKIFKLGLCLCKSEGKGCHVLFLITRISQNMKQRINPFLPSLCALYFYLLSFLLFPISLSPMYFLLHLPFPSPSDLFILLYLSLCYVCLTAWLTFCPGLFLHFAMWLITTTSPTSLSCLTTLPCSQCSVLFLLNCNNQFSRWCPSSNLPKIVLAKLTFINCILATLVHYQIMPTRPLLTGYKKLHAAGTKSWIYIGSYHTYSPVSNQVIFDITRYLAVKLKTKTVLFIVKESAQTVLFLFMFSNSFFELWEILNCTYWNTYLTAEWTGFVFPFGVFTKRYDVIVKSFFCKHI